MFLEKKVSRRDFLKLSLAFVLGVAAFSPVFLASRKLGIFSPQIQYGSGTYGFSSY